MAPEELRGSLRQQPFEPFRIVLTDGMAYEIRHPELLFVGKRSAFVGVTNQPNETYFDLSVKVDLLHIVRIEPLGVKAKSPDNGSK